MKFSTSTVLASALCCASTALAVDFSGTGQIHVIGTGPDYKNMEVGCLTADGSYTNGLTKCATFTAKRTGSAVTFSSSKGKCGLKEAYDNQNELFCGSGLEPGSTSTWVVSIPSLYYFFKVGSLTIGVQASTYQKFNVLKNTKSNTQIFGLVSAGEDPNSKPYVFVDAPGALFALTWKA